MRTPDEIEADAGPQAPFSNGGSGEAWMDRWCYECKVDRPFQRDESPVGCPVLLVGLLGKTPKEWTRVGVQDYCCSEFIRYDDDSGEPEPEPCPDPDGQTDILGHFAEQIAEQVAREAVSAR